MPSWHAVAAFCSNRIDLIYFCQALCFSRLDKLPQECVDWLQKRGANKVGLVGHSRGGVTISQLEGDFCRVTWKRKQKNVETNSFSQKGKFHSLRWTLLGSSHHKWILKIPSGRMRRDRCSSFVALKMKFVPDLRYPWTMPLGWSLIFITVDAFLQMSSSPVQTYHIRHIISYIQI